MKVDLVHHHYPKQVRDLHFVRELPNKNSRLGMYDYALYKDSNNILYLGKFSCKNRLSRQTKKLLSEGKRLQVIEKLLEGVKCSSEMMTDILFNDSAMMYSTFFWSVIFTRYYPTDISLELCDLSEKNIFITIIRKLHRIPVDNTQKGNVHSRLFYISSLLLNICKASYYHPQYFSLFLRALYLILLNLLGDTSLPVIVHGNLTPNSFAKTADGIIISNWSDAAIGSKYEDLGRILTHYWDSKELRKYLIAHATIDIQSYEKLLAYTGYAAFSSICQSNEIKTDTCIRIITECVIWNECKLSSKLLKLSKISYYFKATVLKFFQKSYKLQTSAKQTFDIPNFTFIKPLKGKETAFTGLYCTKHKDLFVAKFWYKENSNLAYVSVLQEKLIYQIMQYISHRFLEPSISGLFDNNCQIIPLKNSFVSVRPYVPGRTLNIINSCDIAKSIILITESLERLYSASIHSERAYMKNRTALHNIFVFPVIFINAFLVNPSLRSSLLKSIRYVVGTLVQLHTAGILTFVHGDLHAENIIRNKKGLFVLDCGQMMVSYRGVDIATSILASRVSDETRSGLRDYAEKRYGKYIFNGLLLYFAIYNLSQKTESKMMNNYTNQFRLSLQRIEGENINISRKVNIQYI